MNPRSQSLFHFTRSNETLKLILRAGFWPRYCLEDVAWMRAESSEYVAYPMVCFCDIPLSRVGEHVEFYGAFGLGMSRAWAEENGLNPVLYVAGDNGVASAYRELASYAARLAESSERHGAKALLRYLLAHSKPTSGKMLVDGMLRAKAFYQESEWRYVPRDPRVKSFLLKAAFESARELLAANEETRRYCTLRFGPKDIRYVFVRCDSDIPEIVKFIQEAFGDVPAVDQKILLTRIVSLESLNVDV